MNVTHSLILVEGPAGKLIVRVDVDGSVTYGEGYAADTAAKEFWDGLGKEYVARFPLEIITRERALDLVRHQRQELHEAGLISDEEYAYLVGIPGSRERLEEKRTQ